jgi:ERCC4-related helicase
MTVMISSLLFQEHLRKKRDGKVIFLVENEALAYQQGKVFSKLLPAYRTKVISGTVQRDKKMFLKDFIHMYDYLNFVTLLFTTYFHVFYNPDI